MKQNSYIPSEYEEQCNFVTYLESLQSLGKIRVFTANPNNTYTKSWGIKIKQKKEGVRKGYPDLSIITHKALCFIEMKRVKRSKLGEEQRLWLTELKRLGIPCAVCYGANEAIDFINKYL